QPQLGEEQLFELKSPPCAVQCVQVGRKVYCVQCVVPGDERFVRTQLSRECLTDPACGLVQHLSHESRKELAVNMPCPQLFRQWIHRMKRSTAFNRGAGNFEFRMRHRPFQIGSAAWRDSVLTAGEW